MNATGLLNVLHPGMPETLRVVKSHSLDKTQSRSMLLDAIL